MGSIARTGSITRSLEQAIVPHVVRFHRAPARKLIDMVSHAGERIVKANRSDINRCGSIELPLEK